ncbi:MAG: hypothetical protein ACK5JT_02915 [Hyphomicrobiaceae bacterium]
MSVLLIDDVGKFWNSDSRHLRQTFDSPFSVGEFVAYAVRNLGFIALNIYGRSCQLRFRPQHLTVQTVTSLLEWMIKSSFERLVFTTFDGDWSDKLLLPGAAVSRLEQLLEQSRGGGPVDILSRVAGCEELKGRSELYDILVAWPHLVGTYDARTLIGLLNSVLNGRAAVVAKSADFKGIQIHELGGDLYREFDAWRTSAIGAPVEEQPIREMGQWVAKPYYSVLETQQSHLESVDAIVEHPAYGRIRRRFRRLILPLPSTSSRQLLIGGSFVDASVDLRVSTR